MWLIWNLEFALNIVFQVVKSEGPLYSIIYCQVQDLVVQTLIKLILG